MQEEPPASCAGGLARLARVPQELGEFRSRAKDIRLAVPRRIALNILPHHDHVSHRQILRDQKFLHILQDSHGLGLDVAVIL